VATETDELGLQRALMVGVGEAGDPFGRGREEHAVAGLAGANTKADGEVGLAGPGVEEDDVLFAGDEVQRAQVRDRRSLQRSGVVVVELLQALGGGEPRGADAPFAAVGFAGGDFALAAGGEELLV
jgi:hypothetical protein